MNKKVTGIMAYFGWLFFLIAYLAGDKEGAKFHLNQALILNIVSTVGGAIGTIVAAIIPLLGGLISSVVSIFVLVCLVLGIIAVVNDEEKELPLIGKFQILK